MSSALGPPLLHGCNVVGNAADDDTDIAAVFADAVTTVAASACDLDDSPPHRCLLHARRFLPCSRHIRSHAQPAVYLP